MGNAKVIFAKVSGIGTTRREVVAEGRRIPYDFLVIATGAEHAYFGHDWASYAPGLKTIDDATYLRRRILLAFERAETEPDPDERRRRLNFVVVGGGPTGVEMGGAIAELAKRALAADFRSIDPRCARIILIEAGPRLLSPFDPSLSEAARRSLQQLGVEVRLRASVTNAIAPESPSAKRACKREPLFGPASKPPQWPNGSAPTVIAPAA
jgi:NADH dehydrogenase